MPSKRSQSARAQSGPSGDRSHALLVAAAFVLSMAVLVVGGMVAVSLAVRKPAVVDSSVSKVEVLKAAVRDDPDDLASRRLLAFEYQHAGEKRDALREYEAVLASSPHDMGALCNAGILHLNLGETAEGERMLKKALELVPTHALAARALAEHYAKRGQYALVLKVVAGAVSAHPEMADLQYLAGLGYEKTGQPGKAAEHYRTAIRMVPGLTAARDGMRRVEASK